MSREKRDAHGRWTATGFRDMEHAEKLRFQGMGFTRGAEYMGQPPNRAAAAARLRDTLLDLGGHAAMVDPLDPNNRVIGSQGKRISGSDVTRVKGKPAARCHHNSVEMYAENPGKYALVTGYATTEHGAWVRHSWLKEHGGGYVDPTNTYQDYFGAELTPAQAELFIATGDHEIPGAPRMSGAMTRNEYLAEMTARATGPGTVTISKMESAVSGLELVAQDLEGGKKCSCHPGCKCKAGACRCGGKNECGSVRKLADVVAKAKDAKGHGSDARGYRTSVTQPTIYGQRGTYHKVKVHHGRKTVASMEFVASPKSNIATISGVYVNTEHRGKGVGHLLYEAAKAHLAEHFPHVDQIEGDILHPAARHLREQYFGPVAEDEYGTHVSRLQKAKDALGHGSDKRGASWPHGPWIHSAYTKSGKVDLVPVSYLQQYRGNPTSGKRMSVAEIAEEIKPGGPGLREPLILQHGTHDHKLVLGEGNHRLEAAIAAGYTHVPVRMLRSTTMYHQNAKPFKSLAKPGEYFPGDERPSKTIANFDEIGGIRHDHESAIEKSVAAREHQDVSFGGGQFRFWHEKPASGLTHVYSPDKTDPVGQVFHNPKDGTFHAYYGGGRRAPLGEFKSHDDAVAAIGRTHLTTPGAYRQRAKVYGTRGYAIAKGYWDEVKAKFRPDPPAPKAPTAAAPAAPRPNEARLPASAGQAHLHVANAAAAIHGHVMALRQLGKPKDAEGQMKVRQHLEGIRSSALTASKHAKLGMAANATPSLKPKASRIGDTALNDIHQHAQLVADHAMGAYHATNVANVGWEHKTQAANRYALAHASAQHIGRVASEQLKSYGSSRIKKEVTGMGTARAVISKTGKGHRFTEHEDKIAQHIIDGEVARGKSKEEAERIAYATVNARKSGIRKAADIGKLADDLYDEAVEKIWSPSNPKVKVGPNHVHAFKDGACACGKHDIAKAKDAKGHGSDKKFLHTKFGGGAVKRALKAAGHEDSHGTGTMGRSSAHGRSEGFVVSHFGLGDPVRVKHEHSTYTLASSPEELQRLRDKTAKKVSEYRATLEGKGFHVTQEEPHEIHVHGKGEKKNGHTMTDDDIASTAANLMRGGVSAERVLSDASKLKKISDVVAKAKDAKGHGSNKHIITLYRWRGKWGAGVKNPQGGSSGGMDGGNKVSALTQALRLVSPGESYEVHQADEYGNGRKKIAEGVKRGACEHSPEHNPRGCFHCIGAEAADALKAKITKLGDVIEKADAQRGRPPKRQGGGEPGKIAYRSPMGYDVVHSDKQHGIPGGHVYEVHPTGRKQKMGEIHATPIGQMGAEGVVLKPHAIAGDGTNLGLHEGFDNAVHAIVQHHEAAEGAKRAEAKANDARKTASQAVSGNMKATGGKPAAKPAKPTDGGPKPKKGAGKSEPGVKVAVHISKLGDVVENAKDAHHTAVKGGK